jgi:hypothetical protein
MRDPSLKLRSDILGNETRTQVWLLDLLDIDLDLFTRQALKVLTQPLDRRTAATNDDPRLGSMDNHDHLIRQALNLNAIDPCVPSLLTNKLTDRQVFAQQVGILFALSKPARLPRLDDPQPKP